MPFYDTTLQTYIGVRSIKGKPVTMVEMLKMGIQLIEALELIHQSGQTFNDLKPDNIMVTKATNKVTLVDFGFT